MECLCQTAAGSNSFRGSSFFSKQTTCPLLFVIEWSIKFWYHQNWIGHIQFSIYPSWRYPQIWKKWGETNLTTWNRYGVGWFPLLNHFEWAVYGASHQEPGRLHGHVAGSYKKTQQKQQEQYQFPGWKSGIVDWSNFNFCWSWAFGWGFSWSGLTAVTVGLSVATTRSVHIYSI